MPKPLPFLNRDWRQSAQQYADDRGFGPLERLPHEQWQAVLRHVELQMQTEGFVLPDQWQAALANQVGRESA